ncbi:hypothetical protein T440DRAFT_512911 [Plenodomus tracheiphilus IPT5]|uniref:Uncharacterized protein n=1 Tax=Plenodomus tracheiphilus IPT5 TaxID=1408161 RepID=A0A6A7BNH4_9PLEO|nr:hypothetical protein T440DRAFT_512911 [Plenodomus tracheiphilus IPT5]
MPGIKKNEVPDFTSVDFPPVPPEAENWQPDPDSIARPGALPDPRFTRDLIQPYHRGSYKIEAKRVKSSAAASPSPALEQEDMRSLGSWPSPVPRATGYPRDLIDFETLPTPSKAPVNEPALTESKERLTLGSKIAVPVDLLEIGRPDVSYRALTPNPQAKSFLEAAPQPRGALLGWKNELDKEIATDTPTGARVVSVPPHLRKQMGKGDVAKEKHRGLNPTASSFEGKHARKDMAAEINVGEEDGLNDEMLARHLAAEEAGMSNGQRSQALQEELLGQLQTQMSISKSVTAATDRGFAHTNPLATSIRERQITHERYRVIIMIRAMEHELDLSKVATMRELMAMGGDELSTFYEKVLSAHKNWWEAERRV